MQPEIRTSENRKTLRDFIRLPEKIHAGHRNWLPPLYADEKRFFNPSVNRAFGYCDTVMAVAYIAGEPKGRIMGIIHRGYNEQHQEKTARFAFFDCFEEPEVAKSLIGFVKDWAMGKGMNRLSGPYGFSDRDPQGFMIEGFNSTPLIDTNCNLPGMPLFIGSQGFSRLVDCITYRYDLRQALPEVYHRIFRRLACSQHYKLLEFRSRNELKPLIIPVLKLINKTYGHLYGFYPLSESEMTDLAKRYMSVIQPEYIKVISCNGEIVAFLVGLSNMADGFRKANGRLLPFGWYHILKSMKTSVQVDLMLGAVNPPQQGQGLEIYMGMKLLESAKKAGIKTIETHLILETNTRMRAVFERLKIPVVKRFRVFSTELGCVERVSGKSGNQGQ